jgi:hypothetical protein
MDGGSALAVMTGTMTSVAIHPSANTLAPATSRPFGGATVSSTVISSSTQPSQEQRRRKSDATAQGTHFDAAECATECGRDRRRARF